MFRLMLDFNDATRDGLFRALQEYAEGPRPLRKGDTVLAHDDGEHEAWASVEQTEGDLVFIAVDWDTFGEPGRLRTHWEPSGMWWAMIRGSEGNRADCYPELLRLYGPPAAVLAPGGVRLHLARDEDENTSRGGVPLLTP
jgi:hypothetical protein